jgi:hippurate hydrolase
MPIVNRIAEYSDTLTAWRRHLHSHPELGYEEVETAAFVAARLREMGVDEVHEGIGRTGVVGVVRGGTGGRRIGLRADMDALPIEEATGLPHASTRPGKMHACGHDGHTTMLLGAAKYLAETRNFDGTVCLVFQPAEEGRAGARAMLEDGLLERFPVEEIYGLHNWPSLPVGEFAMCTGPAMAASDEFRITIKGRGCHAAMPNLGLDPVFVGAQIVLGLQGIVSRETDPVDNAVLSVTRFHAGQAFNVVPETAELVGTVRTFEPGTRDRIERRLGEVAQGIARSFGLDADIAYRRGYPPTVNHAREAVMGADAAAMVVGEERVDRTPRPVMGAEDFAFMLEAVPGSYIWMGSAAGADSPPLHSAHYDFNDEALPLGVSYWAKLVESRLPRAG